MDGKRIKEKRKKMGMTQKELAEVVGVGLSTIQRAEQDINIGTKLLEKIIKVLQLDVDEGTRATAEMLTLYVGNELKIFYVCTSCRRTVGANDNYCKHCGRELIRGAEE